MFLSDTGLFITLAFWDKDLTDNIIYQKLLFDKLPANLGYVYEKMAAQMLSTAGNNLYYYTWEKESKNHLYKIDFLLSRQDKICPIEVKSSSYKTHASLDAFYKKYSERISSSYLIYTKDFSPSSQIQMIPIFMTMFLPN